MKVLHIYSGNLYGGIETMLVTLARCRHLCPNMEPHFAICFDGALSEELMASGANVHRLGNVRISQPFTLARARRALVALLRKEQFDAVICHSAWSQAIFAKVVRQAKLLQVFWLHDVTTGRHWLERWARLTPPDLAICNSEFTARTLPLMYPQVKSEVIYCPVMPPEQAFSECERYAVRAELNTPQNAVVIIQVSRMERWKGQTLHLEALGKLADNQDWVCWIVGGAQRPHEVRFEEELKALAAHFKIADRVRFLGQRSDVPRLLRAADIYCQPNTGAEPFGIAYIEALYAQLPVVTTAMGGACEIVDKTCGMLVPPADANSLASALKDLISDNPLRRKLGAAGAPQARMLCAPESQLNKIRVLLQTVSPQAVAA